jgi:hypothetical protein
MTEIPAIDPDEIIPPGGRSAKVSRDGKDGRDGTGGSAGAAQVPLRGLLPALIARLLDELLLVPGTKVRIGLDPLLSFFPVIGDAVATTAGAGILLAGIRHRAPVSVLARMSGNLALNALFNIIPLGGPVLSVWFRSNSRNNALLQDHLAGAPPGPPTPQARILIAALITLVVLLIALSLFLWISVWRFLDRLFA